MEPQSADSEMTKEEGGLANDERIASLFQPDTLLSLQYFENLRRKTVLEPEKSLMLAILEDAISSYQDNLRSQGKRGKKLFEEAEEWIAETGSAWIFSFESACEALGLNAAYVRRGLLQWKEKNRPKQPPSESWEGKRLAG